MFTHDVINCRKCRLHRVVMLQIVLDVAFSQIESYMRCFVAETDTACY